MKIAVIHGGCSPEGAMSTKNAYAIAGALGHAGHSAQMVEFSQGGLPALASGYDMAFVAVQGKHHGDGTCQAVCACAKIPYTGTRAAAAAVINDKALCKILCVHHNIPTPPFLAMTEKAFGSFAGGGKAAACEVAFPAVAKPATQGGSLGIRYLGGPSDLPQAREAFAFDDEVIIEQYVPGTFVTASVLEVAGRPVVLPLLTAHTAGGGPLQLFGGNFCIEPAHLGRHLEKRVEELSLALFRIFKARGYARIDYMVEKTSHIPYFLEINAVPGLRAKSFFPTAAKLAGYDLPAVCNIIVEQEENRHA